MEKYKNLVHYICYICEDPTKLGSTKLNKILYFSDFLYYKINRKSITGETYIKRQHGPVPKNILLILDELYEEEKLISREVDYFNYKKKEFFTLIKPDISKFSAEEISLIDKVADIIINKHTANSISNLTHNQIWKLAEIGEEIPYYTVFATELDEINENDIKWAKIEIENIEKVA